MPKPAEQHYRIRVVTQATSQESYVCLPNQGAVARWFAAQGLAQFSDGRAQAEVSLVDGATCWYCRQQTESEASA
jgi:hypothetical protein